MLIKVSFAYAKKKQRCWGLFCKISKFHILTAVKMRIVFFCLSISGVPSVEIGLLLLNQRRYTL